MLDKSTIKDNRNTKDIGPFDADFWFRMNSGLPEPHIKLTD